MNRRAFLGAASGLAVAASSRLGSQTGGEADPLGVRKDFPILRTGVYLNAAYNTPTPTPVFEAGCRFVEAKGTRPPSLGDMLGKRDEVRGQFARLVGAEPGEIAFLFATSDGENIVTRALDLKPGDNIVIDDLHYTTTFVLYRQLAKTVGIELRIARHRDGAAPVEIFTPLVDGRTRLVSVAWVSHQNGYRHDVKGLADLAHAHKAFLYLDAIQATGMFPIDVRALGVDFFTTGTYKWLLGGYGVALFFARRDLLDRLRSDRYGFLQVERELPNHEFQLFSDARKFEYATLGFEGIYQLGASLKYLEQVGLGRIESHTVALAHALRQGLADLGFRLLTPSGNRSAIVAFAGRRDLETTRRILNAADVQVTVRENGAAVRVAPALYNTAADVQRFLSAAEQLR